MSDNAQPERTIPVYVMGCAVLPTSGSLNGCPDDQRVWVSGDYYAEKSLRDASVPAAFNAFAFFAIVIALAIGVAHFLRRRAPLCVALCAFSLSAFSQPVAVCSDASPPPSGSAYSTCTSVVWVDDSALSSVMGPPMTDDEVSRLWEACALCLAIAWAWRELRRSA